jgi:hypothetical protein
VLNNTIGLAKAAKTFGNHRAGNRRPSSPRSRCFCCGPTGVHLAV